MSNRPNAFGCFVRIGFHPCDEGKRFVRDFSAAFRLAEAIGRSCPAGVFPFGIRREPERQPDRIGGRKGIQLVQKRLAIIPGDVFHRKLVAFEFRRIVSHDGFPLSLRHFGFPDPETPGRLDEFERDAALQQDGLVCSDIDFRVASGTGDSGQRDEEVKRAGCIHGCCVDFVVFWEK